MRLIDADALNASLLHWDGSETKYCYPCREIFTAIDAQPTVDAVPVIRCKDCKRLGVANMKDKYGQPNPVPCCRRNGHIRLGIKPDDYCSRAERKEE